MYILLLAVSTTLFGQKSDRPDVIYFNSGITSLTDAALPLEGQLNDKRNTWKGRTYTFLHFNTLPNAAQRANMEQMGVHFLEYIPNNTYLVSINTNVDLSILSNYQADGIIGIDTKHKASIKLWSGDVPNYVRSGSKLKLIVRYHKDADAESARTQILSTGASIYDEYAYSNIYYVEVEETLLGKLANASLVAHVEPIAPEPTPEDRPGKALHRGNILDTGNPMLREYDGTGVSIGVGDDGLVGPHVDFQGRIDVSRVPSDRGTHGDMVAGIFMGAGNIDPTARGMAAGAFGHMYDVWDVIDDAPVDHPTLGVMVTNTSYSNGCNAGYTSFANTADDQANQMPGLLHVFSAGNAGTSDCGYGAGSGWGNVTGGIKIGKNVLAVANLDNDGNLQNSSSRGPAHDGRIKPDIASNGAGQISTRDPNDYRAGGGTSAAAPGIAGLSTQLYHAYRELNGGSDPESALIKACLLNTAEDRGNLGPDFLFGYGRVNAYRAVRVLEENTYWSNTVDQGANTTASINVPAGTAQLRVMLYWLDPAAGANASFALVNNLDLQITDPQSNAYLPWVLDPTPDPALLDLPATRGSDNLNNMEQVTIESPIPGNYTVSVSGAAVPFGPQKYYIVYQFIQDEILVVHPYGGESFIPGEEVKIRWDAYDKAASFDIQLSTDNGGSWASIANNVTRSDELTYDWTVPNTLTGGGLVRIVDGTVSAISNSSFNIMPTPDNITVVAACPSSFTITWDAVTGADDYTVHLLGNKYMDVVGNTSATSYTVTGINPIDDYWVSVSASNLQDGIIGRRAYATNKTPGLGNCPQDYDLELANILSPVALIQGCYNSSATPVILTVSNEGLQTVNDFTLYYRVDGGTIQSESISAAALGASTNDQFTLTSTINLSTPGIYQFKAWVVEVNDTTPFNDTLSVPVEVQNTPTYNLPFIESFDTYNDCNTSADCEATVCPIPGGWINATNIFSDDIDWRIDSDGTFSNGTGPDVDHTTGTTSGQYIYLEASSSCYFKEAILITPCVAIPATANPVVEFWYHMEGDDMGELHVDVFDGTTWNLDVIPVISGDQGGNWNEGVASLQAYLGQTVSVRFRGITGDGIESDVALDDISIKNFGQAPVTDFEANNTSVCLGEVVELSDLSLGASSYDWAITPSSFTFVNGTNANSASPQVIFQDDVQYTITLTASNANGSDTETKINYVGVRTIQGFPFAQDFETFTLATSDWELENPDGNITWQTAGNVTGSNGNTTTVQYYNCYNYNDRGQRDGLITPPIEIAGGLSSVELSFDVAHAPYSSNFNDGLIVEISTDCGATYNQLYDKRGALFGTTALATSSWNPQAASDWREEVINLTNYTGNTVVIRFVGVNDWGNNVFLDNININGQVVIAAGFNSSSNTICVGDMVTFSDNSQGPISAYDWDFGNNANPATATGQGPHQVTYIQAGNAMVNLSITNGAITDNFSDGITIDPTPTANYTLNQQNDTINLTDGSSNASQITWQLGDGTTIQNDVTVDYIYQDTGTFTIFQIVSNNCGTDTAISKIEVIPSEVDSIIDTTTIPSSVATVFYNGLSVYPIPTEDVLYFELTNSDAKGTITLFDLTGKAVISKEVNQVKGELNVEQIAAGAYILVWDDGVRKRHARVVVQ